MPFIHASPPALTSITRTTGASGKRWYVTPDGKYPSITTVLGQREKPQLQNWRNMLGDKKADKETKRAADRGTAVHKMIEMYLSNVPLEDVTRGHKPEHIAGFNQVKLLLKGVTNIRGLEMQLYSKDLMVAGTVDCIAEYNGTLCVVDFKTSNGNKTRDMIEDYYLQTTAYAIMWHEMTQEPIEDVVILMSVERGMVPLTFKERIDKYVGPLLTRIDGFYKGTKNE